MNKKIGNFENILSPQLPNHTRLDELLKYNYYYYFDLIACFEALELNSPFTVILVNTPSSWTVTVSRPFSYTLLYD